jgi:hypothetical protein
VPRCSFSFTGLRRTIAIAQESACSTPPRPPNPRQTWHRKRGRKGQSGRSECARCHKQSHELGLIRTLPSPLHAGIYRKPSVYGFVKSMRSLALRTVSGCKPRYRTCLLCMVPCVGALAGHLEPSIHAHAYTRDIRNFVLTRPWATILDLQVYRACGWREWNGPKAVLAIKGGKLVKSCHADLVSLWVIGSLWPPTLLGPRD